MSIVYYPNRVYKGKVPAIDRVMAQRKPTLFKGTYNITATPMSVILSNDDDWQVDSIGWDFSNAAARNFYAYIMNGRQVVANLNDSLWLVIPGAIPQSITLNPGFYTGTQLATELQTRLNANVAFTALGVIFTVVYNAVTGIYTITPNSGTIKYFDVNTSQVLSRRDSIAGHLFGLTATTNWVAAITSDTAVMSLDSENAIVAQAISSDLTYLHNDIHIMDVDQALHLTSNTAAVAVDLTIVYELLV